MRAFLTFHTAPSTRIRCIVVTWLRQFITDSSVKLRLCKWKNLPKRFFYRRLFLRPQLLQQGENILSHLLLYRTITARFHKCQQVFLQLIRWYFDLKKL